MRFFLLVVILLLTEARVSSNSQDFFPDYVEGFYPDYPSEEEFSMEPFAEFIEDYWNLLDGFKRTDTADFAPFIISDNNFYDESDEPLILLETSDDEPNDTDLFASGCPWTGRLGARDGQLQCPTPEAARTREQKIPVPKLPLYGEFNDIGPPPAFSQGEDSGCPPMKPYHLCCDCNGWVDFGLCVDCTPCKLVFTLFSLP